MQIKTGYNTMHNIDEELYNNRCDYLRDIKYATNWKYKLFGYLPKDFGTDTDKRTCEGSYFYGKPPQAPKPKERK